MNIVLPPHAPAPHKFVGADVLRMQDEGILPADHRLQLIEGELIDMGSEGERHSDLKTALVNILIRSLPATYVVGPDTTLRLAEDSWPEPDVFIHLDVKKTSQVRGGDALLVIEIADTSLAYDLGEKAKLYARHGVREYWVIDAVRLQTHVHRGPSAEGAWSEVGVVERATAISPLAVPQLAFRLSEID
jgi:Uma2 family endonuclease